jgi:hypothetical protein
MGRSVLRAYTEKSGEFVAIRIGSGCVESKSRVLGSDRGYRVAIQRVAVVMAILKEASFKPAPFESGGCGNLDYWGH